MNYPHFYNANNCILNTLCNVNSNGCHVHFYLEGKDKEHLKKLKKKAKNLWDVVSFSWEYIYK